MKTIRFTLMLITLMVITIRTESQVVLVSEKSDSSAISNLTTVEDKLFFTSCSFKEFKDSVEIWATKGSLNSSRMIKKLPNYSNIMGTDPLFFINYKGNLIFQALESFTTDKFGNTIFNPYLWKSDGTTEGTIKLKKLETWFYLDDDYPETWGGKYIQLDDKLIFTATPPDTLNYELWSTDGTSDGTVKLVEINKKSGSSFPTSLTKLGNKVFFEANDAIHGQELWVTNGSAAGTCLVKDIYPGDTGSMGYYYHQEEFSASISKLFFTVDFARQLWVSDGSEAGTKKINKFDYSVTSQDNGIFVRNLTDVNGELFFEVGYWNYKILANDSLLLWKSDGSENGTSKVYSLDKMNVSSYTNYKSGLYFMNKNAGLYELWKTDGTKNGTLKISEFKVPENSTSKLYAFNDSLYFAAFDNKNILKIWKSDGTNDGTNPVENWNEFTLTSISDMVLFNDGIYFSATQPNNRTELFKYLNGTHYLSKVEILVSLNKLGISPNPALNYLNVNLPDKKQNGIITIYDIRGSKILSIVVQPGQQFISADVSNLKNGLYIVSFSGNSGTSVTKFVKK